MVHQIYGMVWHFWTINYTCLALFGNPKNVSQNEK